MIGITLSEFAEVGWWAGEQTFNLLSTTLNVSCAKLHSLPLLYDSASLEVDGDCTAVDLESKNNSHRKLVQQTTLFTFSFF